MPAEKNTKPTQDKANPKADIKKLESELKLAFKESKFDDVRKIAENLQKLDPANGMAKKLLGKAEDAEAAAKAKKNAGKIQELEGELMLAFKQGDIPKVSDMIDKIRELDPKNKKCSSIETKILKAKASLDMQVKKEKMKTIMSALKELLKMSQWDRAVEEANKLMKLEWNHSVAMKAFKMVSKEKGVDVNSLITVKEPKRKAKKPGFFARIFKKKAEPVKAEDKKDEEKKAEGAKPAMAKKEEKKDEAKPTEAKEEKKPAMPAASTLGKVEDKKGDAKPKEAEKADKEKLKTLGKDLKAAVKEVKEEEAKKLIDELKKLDPTSKLIEKSEKALEKAVAKKTEKEKKEKVKTLSKELKEIQKSKDWDKVKSKAEELFQVDEKNKLVEKALKQIEKETGKRPELKKAAEPKPALPARRSESEGGSKDEGKEEVKRPGANIFKAEEKPALSKVEEKPEVKIAPAAAPKPATSAKLATPATPAPAKPAVSPIAPAAAPKPATSAKLATPDTPAPAKPAVSPIAPAATPKPVTPAAPAAAIAPVASGAKPMMMPAAPAAAAKPAAKPAEGEKGNIFTSLFGKEEKREKGSIIDTIVEKSDVKEGPKKEEKKKKESTGVGLLKFSTALLQLSVLFIAISAAFFYVQHIDVENRVLALAGIETNNASTLRAAANELDDREGEENDLNREIGKYKEDYNAELKKTIQGIIENRLDWPGLLKDLNEVTESVYEKNALLGYVEYNNYSYDVNSKTLTVSATLSDPQGRNLTKLAELEEAFTYYPVDKDNPDDERTPYFFGMQEFNSYAKTFNTTTGRYMSSFSLSLQTEKGDEKK